MITYEITIKIGTQEFKCWVQANSKADAEAKIQIMTQREGA